MSKHPLSFRSTRITYYGPHPCENCGVTITKMGNEFGGNAFTYPKGNIYPNTEWHVHVCDPHDVRETEGIRAREFVLDHYAEKGWEPILEAVRLPLGWVILRKQTCVSTNQTYSDSELGAWRSAQELIVNYYPTWSPPSPVPVIERKTYVLARRLPEDGGSVTDPEKIVIEKDC